MLIRKTRALQEHKDHLEEQQRQLQLEQQYAGDLSKLRGTRQHKVLNSLGLAQEEPSATSATSTPAILMGGQAMMQQP